MLVLALDTATPAVTVALHDGDRVLAHSTTVDAMRAGELLTPGIDRVLAEAGATVADLTEVVVGVGPGPFTGLRVGLVTAHTLAAVLRLPLHGVCTLDVIAADGPADGGFLVATDARRREVYWARYADRYHRVDGPHVDRPAAVPTGWPVAGEGAVRYAEEFPDHREPSHPSAATLADLFVSGRAALLPAEPLYLRRPDVAEPGSRKRVLT